MASRTNLLAFALSCVLASELLCAEEPTAPVAPPVPAAVAAPAVPVAPEAPAAAEVPVAVAAPTLQLVHVPEGTEVPLLFVDSLSSATNSEGDRFALRVDGDVRVGGKVVIPAGSIAVGVVTNARKKGYMGKAGELNITLDHVSVGDQRIKLRANKAKEGEGKLGATVALTVLFGPIGFLKRGHDVDIKPGTPITAQVDQGFDATVQ